MDEALEIGGRFREAYRGRRVLITGHSGFKGSWLAFWLERMGAKTMGCALPPPTNPSHFELLKLSCESRFFDIANGIPLLDAFLDFQPEIVFHLAAQPLVRLSYREPVETFATNVMGTVKALETCRKTPSVRAIVVVTSDKCYENREQPAGYRESDPMGGYDPYSASKGCAELVVASYRRSFFNPGQGGGAPLLASCRAGNVIGGGDWAEDRLLPDIMKAASQGKRVEIRNPKAVRPWQHVLEPLSGYLLVGERLLAGDASAAEAWNFGPDEEGSATVEELAALSAEAWPGLEFDISTPKEAPHEAGLLRLDCSKAKERLGWRPVWGLKETVKRTVEWYRSFYANEAIETASDLAAYVSAAREKDLPWTK